MPVPITSCCVSVLNDQQQAIAHHKHYNDSSSAHPQPPKSEHCTVVEDGRVVIKPRPESFEAIEQSPEPEA